MKVEAFIDNMISSLDANRTASGFSGRKLSALFGVIMAAFITIFKLPTDGMIRLYAQIVWLLFALLCLGIVTVQQVIEFKNGGQPKKDEPA